jgi:mRNA-degrading endonuclease YafQ of YafQ-DinJ toxin-antitoxin module
MYTLVRTSAFDRSLARFLRKHPELRQQVARVLRDLEADPFQPRLRLHALSGQMEGISAIRITRSYRITLRLAVAPREITLIDIGSHDDVYR